MIAIFVTIFISPEAESSKMSSVLIATLLSCSHLPRLHSAPIPG